MLKNSLLILIFCMGFISCEKDIEYKGIEINNFLVMNSILSPDSVISCKITRSNTLFESTPIQSITDASVGLFSGDDLIENLMHLSEGTYVSESGAKPQVGSNYTIKASHHKYESINATTQLLIPVEAKITSFKEGKSSDDYYYDPSYSANTALKFEVKIDDLGGEDYYRLQVYAPNVNYVYDEDYNYEYSEEPPEVSIIISDELYQQSIISNDPVLNNNKVIVDSDFEDAPFNSYTVFNDILFDGESYTLRFEIYNVAQGAEEADKQQILDAIQVDVQKISKDLYKHFVTVTASNYYGDSPFSEPVQVFSNITGGAGILGSSTSNILSLKDLSSTDK